MLAIDPGLDEAWAGELSSELNRFCNEPDAAILPRLYERRNATSTHEITAIGHAHLDTAWLWPLAETYARRVRTFTTQLRYMDEYPEYRFGCSQAQQYAWIKERNPELWTQIRARGRAGQFVPVGGTWIEPDCNIPSGESLVRQFLHGQRFFEQEFGRRCTRVLEPRRVRLQRPAAADHARGRASTRFLTQKLSWNRFNKPEHHTFTWQGIDGSEVLAHFPPADTYNADATGRRAARQRPRLQGPRPLARRACSSSATATAAAGRRGRCSRRSRRADDLQGLPRTHASRRRRSSSTCSRRRAGERPTVVGELYFEYHRGTYTTQAATKRGNRRCEISLCTTPSSWRVAARRRRTRATELDRLWKLLLLNQFHDILPGSSIRLVYEDAERDLAEVESGAEAICATRARRRRRVTRSAFPRREVGSRPAARCASSRRRPRRRCGRGRRRRASWPTVWRSRTRTCAPSSPPDGTRGQPRREGDAAARRSQRRATGSSSTRTARPTSTRGTSTRSTSRRAATARRPSRGASRADRRSAPRSPSSGRSARRAVRAGVRLDAGSRRLEFHTTSTGTRSTGCSRRASRSRCARRTRPTRCSSATPSARRTSRRCATARGTRCPGHRFADLSEHGFGAALLTDCKYGYSCYGGELRISLLRVTEEPRPRGRHGRATSFAYALLPHAGGWREAGVVAEALRFNVRCAGRTAPERRVARLDRRCRASCSTRSSARRTRTPSCCASTRRTAHAASQVRLGVPFDGRARQRARGRRRPATDRGRRGPVGVPAASAAHREDLVTRIILCLGLATRDTIWRVPVHPPEDGRVVAGEMKIAGGGPAATAAVAISRLGVATSFVGAVGDDDAGSSCARSCT